MIKNHFLLLIFLSITTITFGQQTSKTQLDFFRLVNILKDYKNGVSESYYLTRSWIFIDKKPGTPGKIKLEEFCLHRINNLNEGIKSFSYLLDTADLRSFSKIKEETDKLVENQKRIMGMLNSFASYDDPVIMFELIPLVEDDGLISSLANKIEFELNKLLHKKTLEYIDLIAGRAAGIKNL
jgi:hypothetical protein